MNGPLVPQLANSLDQAGHQMGKGSNGQGAKHLEDFIKHLNNPALSGNVTEAARAALEDEVRKLIAGWMND